MPLTKPEALNPLRAVLATLRAKAPKTDDDRAKMQAIRAALGQVRGEGALDESEHEGALEALWSTLRDLEALTTWAPEHTGQWNSAIVEMAQMYQRGELLADTENGKLPSVTKVKNMLRRYARGEVTAAPEAVVEYAHDIGERVWDIVVDGRPSEVAYVAAIAAVDDSTTVDELTALAQQGAEIARRAEARAERRAQG